MRTFGVKPHQVIQQFIVEQIHVGKQQIFVVGNELVLDTAIKTFDMGVHFGGLGKGQPAVYVILRDFHIERGFDPPSLSDSTRSTG